VDAAAIVKVLIVHFGWPIVTTVVALVCVVLLTQLARRMMSVNETVSANLIALATKLEGRSGDPWFRGR
jgi:hypothetical protein